MPQDPHCNIDIHIDALADSDSDELAKLTRGLRKELEASGELERVEPGIVTAPPDSKFAGGDLQSLIVTLAASGGVLTTLIGLVQSFVTRREKASVTLEINGDKIVITSASPETERLLAEDWIARHKS